MEGGSELDKINSNSDFRTQIEELVHLQEEISGIRSLIREATSKLNQIERHLKRAFPEYKPVKTNFVNKRVLGEEKTTLVRESALKLFDSLRQVAQDEGGNAIEKRLSALSMADIRYLSQELGLPSGSKLSRTKLNSGIVGRLNESIMLSRNINISHARAEGIEHPDNVDLNTEIKE